MGARPVERNLAKINFALSRTIWQIFFSWVVKGREMARVSGERVESGKNKLLGAWSAVLDFRGEIVAVKSGNLAQLV
jgi:hypothetical protein